MVDEGRNWKDVKQSDKTMNEFDFEFGSTVSPQNRCTVKMGKQVVQELVKEGLSSVFNGMALHCFRVPFKIVNDHWETIVVWFSITSLYKVDLYKIQSTFRRQ